MLRDKQLIDYYKNRERELLSVYEGQCTCVKMTTDNVLGWENHLSRPGTERILLDLMHVAKTIHIHVITMHWLTLETSTNTDRCMI